jgi:tRNA threonylcarbamoyl adenosine modification protein (Sua5/YciO/YrdC/YwlC family)
VYGFLADASNKKAVDNIYRIKRRPKSKPLSVFVKDFKMAKKFSVIDNRQAAMLKKYWPGKYTFIVKRKKGTVLYGVKKDTIGIRIPNHKFLQKLLKKINRPLAQTSVNISTKKALHSVDDILATFGNNKLVSMVIDGGGIKKQKPSKIIDVTSNKNKLLRT